MPAWTPAPPMPCFQAKTGFIKGKDTLAAWRMPGFGMGYERGEVFLKVSWRSQSVFTCTGRPVLRLIPWRWHPLDRLLTLR